MVVGIVCDGDLVVPDDLEKVLPKKAVEFSSIDFQSAEPRDLARNSLEVCKIGINGVETNMAEIVEDLQKSQVTVAMGRMGPMFGRLNETYRGLNGVLQLMRIDPESVELSKGTAASLMNGMVDQLREIKETLENQDYVRLADLFEYELRPMLEDWRQLIANLTESLDQD